MAGLAEKSAICACDLGREPISATGMGALPAGCGASCRAYWTGEAVVRFATALVSSTSCGRFVAASRLSKIALCVPTLVTSKAYVPFPALKALAGSVNSTYAFVVPGTALPSSVPAAGALFQLIVVSAQVLAVAYTFAACELEVVTNSRSFALLTAPLSPVTLNMT